MKFKSNTEMIRHYCAELLEDGQSHGTTEIRAYVNEHAGQKGVGGEPLSAQTVNAVLANSFERTGRGVYRNPSSGIQQDVPPRTETDKLLCGLKRVDAALSDALTLSYCDLPLTGEGLQELFSMGMQIRILIRQARELAALEAPVIKVEQPATETQGGPRQETKGPGMGLTM